MPANPQDGLSRRERQIMEIVYRHGRVTAAEVREELPDPPGYSTVRTLLRILEDKGHLRHEQDGPRYLYRPTLPRSRARRTALQGLLRNFFDGSRERMIEALLDAPDRELSAEELDRLADLIDRARREGR